MRSLLAVFILLTFDFLTIYFSVDLSANIGVLSGFVLGFVVTIDLFETIKKGLS